jgi:transaldolase
MLEIYIDSGNPADIEAYAENPAVSGFTTNPSLMRKSGIVSYTQFAKRILEAVPKKPVCFEVLTDDLKEMGRQALQIALWGENVVVKVPVTNTRGESTTDLIRGLEASGVKVNLTAVFTIEQIESSGALPHIISIFAGRIADTGVDPEAIFRSAKVITSAAKPRKTKLLWASTREVFNIKQAERAGADIITVSPEIYKKFQLLYGKDLEEYSLYTVQEFYRDAKVIPL